MVWIVSKVLVGQASACLALDEHAPTPIGKTAGGKTQNSVILSEAKNLS